MELNHFVLGCIQRNEDAEKLLWLYHGVHGEHLIIQLLWATAQLLVPRISPIYLVDEFVFLFLVLLKEMRMLSEYKVLPFLVLVLIKRMRR